MPDMCYIEIVIEKEEVVTSEEKMIIEQRLIDKYGYVDYGKVIPEPLNILNWSYNSEKLHYASIYYDHNPDKLEPWETYLLFHYPDETRPVEIKRGDKIINKSRVMKYGEEHKNDTPNLKMRSFFDWCCDNWDTKWPGSHVEFSGNSFKFENPYGMPSEPIMKYIMRTLCDVTKAPSLYLYVDIEASDYDWEFTYNRQDDELVEKACVPKVYEEEDEEE